MKKLLVVALCALMVFGLAAMASAAIAFKGEIKTGININPDADTRNGIKDGNLEWTGSVNDTVSYGAKFVFASGTCTLDYASMQVAMNKDSFVKMGFFGFNPNAERDILGTGFVDVKDDFTAQYEVKSGALTFDAAIDGDGEVNGGATPFYGLKVGYAADAFGLSFGYEGYDESDISGYQVTGGYNIVKGFRVFGVYTVVTTNDVDATSSIAGLLYNTAPLTVRFEYDTEIKDMAFRVDYVLSNGIKVEYTYLTDDSIDQATHEIDFILAF